MKSDLNRILRDEKEKIRKVSNDKDRVLEDQASDLAMKDQVLAKHTAMTDEIFRQQTADMAKKDSALDVLTTRCTELLTQLEEHKNVAQEKEALQRDSERHLKDIADLITLRQKLVGRSRDREKQYQRLATERDHLSAVKHNLEVERDTLKVERDELKNNGQKHEHYMRSLEAELEEADCSVLSMMNRLETATSTMQQSMDAEVSAQRKRLARKEHWNKML